MQGLLRITRLAIVVLWVVLLGSLARSHLPQGSVASPAGLVPPAAPATAADEWMGLYMKGRKIGYTHGHIQPGPSGYQVEETSYMRLSVLDEEQTVNTAISAATGTDHALRSFSLALNSGVGRLAVDGQVADNALTLRIHTAGETSEQRLALDGPVFLPSTARLQLRGSTLAPGYRATFSVFDPSAMANHPLEIAVVGRETLPGDAAGRQAWKVRETFRGIESTVWLDADGQTLREEGPLGIVAEREDAGRAISSGWGDTSFDLMAAIAVPVRGAIANPRTLQTLSARFSGLGQFPMPADQRQTPQADGTVRIERERDLTATYTLPYTGTDHADDLAATPFLQIDQPRLRDAATHALAGATDPRQAAERLRRWVYGYLEKRPAATIPNALQVLDMGSGDCNEHAVLFAALARASGLPARVVAGIVYSEGSFLYHAWNEVWLGSGWVTVDPAFDQMPADATHVKLIAGGPEAHAGLVPIIGQLSVDVLAQPEPAAG